MCTVKALWDYGMWAEDVWVAGGGGVGSRFLRFTALGV